MCSAELISPPHEILDAYLKTSKQHQSGCVDDGLRSREFVGRQGCPAVPMQDGQFSFVRPGENVVPRAVQTVLLLNIWSQPASPETNCDN